MPYAALNDKGRIAQAKRMQKEAVSGLEVALLMRGFSQKQLASRARTTQSTVSRLATFSIDERELKPQTIARIAKVLNVAPSFITTAVSRDLLAAFFEYAAQGLDDPRVMR